MYLDYHSHSFFSFDGECDAEGMIRAAISRGVKELCFTDHVDFDLPEHHVPDFSARRKELNRLAEQNPQIMIRHGAEVSLRDAACAQNAWEAVKNAGLDYILASVHTIDGTDVWRDCFYDGKEKTVAYREYLETVADVLPTFPCFQALGHYDFVAKYAPYSERSVSYSIHPEAFDKIFTCLIENGKTMEINTASWQQDRPWGLDILKRFHELGGEFVTVGSDTHGAERVGARIPEAISLAKSAGIRYIASYDKGKPILHKIP